jgi:hypothetical protein
MAKSNDMSQAKPAAKVHNRGSGDKIENTTSSFAVKLLENKQSS